MSLLKKCVGYTGLPDERAQLVRRGVLRMTRLIAGLHAKLRVSTCRVCPTPNVTRSLDTDRVGAPTHLPSISRRTLLCVRMVRANDDNSREHAREPWTRHHGYIQPTRGAVTFSMST